MLLSTLNSTLDFIHSGVKFTEDDLWALATLLCASLSVSLIGVNLLLRRLSLLGDALSHAVLPGVIASVVIFKDTNSAFILIGALCAGLISVAMMRFLEKSNLMPESALGATFTTFFAIGVLGLNVFGSHIDLDPSCLLYGSLELTSLETVSLFSSPEVPKAAISSALTLLAVIAVSLVFRRGLIIAAFEPQRAKLFKSHHQALIEEIAFLTIAAASVVNCFFAVGAIATTGILVSPAVVARLFSTSMPGMWVITFVVTTVIAVGGYSLAIIFDTPVAGAVSAFGFLLVVISALISPFGGLVTKFLRAHALTFRISCDDILADRYRLIEESKQLPPLPRSLTELWLIIARFLQPNGQLAPRGLLRAQSLIRSHRVWEDYLTKQLNYSADHVHEPSHRMEHFLSPALTENVAAQQNSLFDPHGKPIPPAPSRVKDD